MLDPFPVISYLHGFALDEIELIDARLLAAEVLLYRVLDIESLHELLIVLAVGFPVGRRDHLDDAGLLDFGVRLYSINEGLEVCEVFSSGMYSLAERNLHLFV